VNLLSDNEILVHYQTPWGPAQSKLFAHEILNDRFFVTLREKNLQVALSDVNQRAKDSVAASRIFRRPSLRRNGNSALVNRKAAKTPRSRWSARLAGNRRRLSESSGFATADRQRARPGKQI